MDPGTKYSEPRFNEKRQHPDGQIVSVFTVHDDLGTLQIDCNICGVKINGKKNFEKHADGKKHLTKITKGGLKIVEEAAPTQVTEQTEESGSWCAGEVEPVSNLVQQPEEAFRSESIIVQEPIVLLPHEVYTPQYKAREQDLPSESQKESSFEWEPDEQLLAHIATIKDWPKELPSRKQLMKSHDVGYMLHKEYFDAPRVQPEIQRVCRTSEMCNMLEDIHSFALQVAQVNLHSLQEVAVLKTPGDPFGDLGRAHSILQNNGYQVLTGKQLTEVVQYMWNTQYLLEWLSKDLGEARRKLYLDLCPENKEVLSKLDMTHDWLFGSDAPEKLEDSDHGQERKRQRR